MSFHFKSSINKIVIYALLTFIAVFAVTALWFAFNHPIRGAVESPKGRYRIDFYSASFIDRLLLNSNMESPGYAWLVEAKTGRVLSKSGLTELYGNSDILWNINVSQTIMVGVDIEFKNVEPEE
jgi:hypothetical protein